MTEIYVSTDIETDGPIPGPHSMLSLGSAAFMSNELVSTFHCNLELLPQATGHPVTMEWWSRNPEAWQASRVDLRRPNEAIPKYADWLNGLPGKPVFVGYPAAFDFMFVYWYLISFCGTSPFAHSALDIKSYAMAVLKKNYRSLRKTDIQILLNCHSHHTHTALDDAIQQGILFCSLLSYNLKTSTSKKTITPDNIIK